MDRKWWTLTTVCLGMFMLLLDITIVNVALPSIAKDLGASFTDLQWTIDAYAVSLAAILLVAGSLGDLLGHRSVFAAGLVVFSVCSLLCGLASDPLFLNISRAAQGIGGAAMFATSLALIAQEFRGRERGTALGIWGATAGASVAVGPLIGGALTSGINWRWVFIVNVPIGALTLWLLLAKVAETRRRHVRPDWPGAIAFSGALFGLVYGLIRGNPDGWSSTGVLIGFIGGGALLVLFVLIEYFSREPMVDLALFRRPAFVGASLGALALSASLFSMFLYITLYLQNILGYSAFRAGLRFLPATLLVLLVAPIAGKLSARVPVRFLLAAGLLLVGVGLGLMTLVGPSSAWTALLAGFIVAGAGSGLTNPPLASAAIGTVPEDKAGVGSGVNNTARQVGLAAGIAGLGAVFQSRVHEMLGSQHAPRVAFVAGFDRILWIAAAIAVAGAVLALVLVHERDFETSSQESSVSAPTPVSAA
ncbi:MAG TPA: DHA2 family efflux MFS transporter permease subunit [Thermoleophilaceae bacterium]|jgi:EmrB/QacA subfamily drug resistance transporter